MNKVTKRQGKEIKPVMFQILANYYTIRNWQLIYVQECLWVSLNLLSQSESLQNLLDHLQEFWRSKNMNLMLGKVGRYIASAFRSYELYQSKIT